ncbi:AraC family transcriptional regulator [Echinicola strongylocentroti]|uniref:AraC family transcriptional regulator n=1 Tax=Echinicola strongylocentroti TaxID=1795355 RepID=A0A2Z4IG01_9BACT|nr:helix-turn-helix transcriptional regulator [Echinicola strongylocentroti]AWW29617.1 AraC family transcriptional regulator [Echinicola strongylocentroti]
MINIPQIPFKSKKDSVEIEVLNLSELFLRIEEDPNHDPRAPHRISFFALLIVTEGEGFHQVDLQKYAIQKGTVVKIAKDQVHAFQGDLTYDGYLVVFTEDFVLKYFSQSSIEFISHLYNYHLSEPIVGKSSINDSFIGQLLEELQYNSHYAHKEILAKILELYLLKLERFSNNPALTNKVDSVHYSQFIQFKDLVEKNFQRTRNVKDYAETMAISPKHLNLIVKGFTLYSAKHFIDQYVVLEIKRTILCANNSLKEVAYRMGFDEVTNFTKFFKKQTGQTPKSFKSSM